MMSNWITAIGLSAATLTTISSLPQVLKSWRTKHTKDVSLPMFLLLGTGMALWLTYGLLIYDIPIISANIVALFLVSIIIGLKLKFG